MSNSDKPVRWILNTLLAYSMHYKCCANKKQLRHQSSARYVICSIQIRSLTFSLPETPGSKVSSGGDTTIRDYVCRSRCSVSLIFVYHPESQPGAPCLRRTNPPALLTHTETSPSPNQCAVCVCVCVFLFLNLVWSVLCSGMHPPTCQMGESRSLFRPDQRYCR